jgi:hypothetical protein
MKEIDFIPQWYKAGRKRQVSYRRQYSVMGIVVAIMLIWSFVGNHTISRANAELNTIEASLHENAAVLEEYSSLENQILTLKEKADLLNSIDDKIDLPAVLGEISYLVSEKIVLSKVEFKNELFGDPKTVQRTSRVTFGSSAKSGNNPMPTQHTRFKVVIAGLAADPSDVASLIARLEGSQYFARIIPGFSKNKTVKDHLVTEFEIGCYLANYVERTGDK